VGLRPDKPHDAPANVEADAKAGSHVDEEDGVVALVSHGLGVGVDEPGFLDKVGDDEDDFTVGEVCDLEGFFDNIPADELIVLSALFEIHGA